MTVKLVRRRSPASQETVAEAERLLEVRIPDQYRRLLLEESNGGQPEENIYWRGEWPSPGVDEFLGVGRGDDADLVRVYGQYRDRMPSWCLPFADAGGDWLCLSLREEDAGAVYFWFHEEEVDEGEPATERNLYPIAGSFEEFWAGLKPIDEVDIEIDESKVEKVWVDPKFAEEMRRRRLVEGRDSAGR